MAESGYLVSDETRKAVWDKAHSTDYAERYYQRLGNENRRRERLGTYLGIAGSAALAAMSFAILSDVGNPWIPVAMAFSCFLMAGGFAASRVGGCALKASVWTSVAETYGWAGPKLRALLDAIDLNEIEDGDARGKLRRLTRRMETAIEQRVKSTRNWRGVVPDDISRRVPLPEPPAPPPRPTPPPPPPEHPHLRTEDRRGHASGDLENRRK